MEKIIIYLTNPTHINMDIAATESIPLNIGYLATYAKKIFGDKIEVQLFNLHSELNEAIETKRPHILGASNYAWNSNLSYYSLSYYKKQNPKMITIMGGPSFSYKSQRQREFLSKRRHLDFYIAREGEIAFADFIQACLAHNMDIDEIKKTGVRGCHYLIGDKLASCPLPDRIQDLNIIPSPYLEGFLDKFLERGFTPILQSNRGCPFSCAYCCSGIKYYNRIAFFDIERVKQEIEYIAKRVKSPDIYIHDDNFAMFEQDYEICRKFKETQRRDNWPVFIIAVTGKNAEERVVRCVELLGPSMDFSVSVQSTNEEVLKNINRKNIRLKDFWSIQHRIKGRHIRSNSEFILPLPGETLESHLEGIRTLMRFGVDSINPYTTMLLPGSPLYEEESFDKFQMVRKYRVIPRDFGKYEGTNVVEVEEVCVATKDLSFDEYLFLRGFHFMIYCYYNKEIFKEIICYLKDLGLEAYDFCYALLSSTDTAPNRVKIIFQNFLSDTKQELWDSEEDIYERYREDLNFDRLIAQKEGYNLLQRYHGLVFASYFRDFLEYGLEVASRLINNNGIDPDEKILRSISSYVANSRGGIFDIARESAIGELDYDVHTWRQEGFKRPIWEYNNKTRLKFSQTQKQKDIIRHFVKTYGSTDDAKGKILTRTNPKLLFREISALPPSPPPPKIREEMRKKIPSYQRGE